MRRPVTRLSRRIQKISAKKPSCHKRYYFVLFTTSLFATIILVIFTLLPIWRFEAWWVRSLDFPRLQLFVISLLLLSMDLVMLDLSQPSTWILCILALLCLVYHAWWILPYTRLFPVEVKSAVDNDLQRVIRIMTANVLTPNRNAKALIELVRENVPDILVTLESDLWWQAQLDTLKSDYPYTIKCPLDNLYGMHVYSRLPLADSQIDYLVEPDIPSMHTLVTLPSGDKIRHHFLHPAPPSPTENEESSQRDAELIIVAKSVAETDTPVIVTGDLNDVAWSRQPDCSGRLVDCSTPVLAVACSIPFTPTFGSCVGRWITCFTATISPCPRFVGYRASVQTILPS